MGGFGALRNGLKYHETFGAIIALSAVAMLDADILNPSETSTLPIDRMAVRRWHYGNDLMAALESDRNPACLVKKLAEEGAEFPAIYMACGESDFLLEKTRHSTRCSRPVMSPIPSSLAPDPTNGISGTVTC